MAASVLILSGHDNKMPQAGWLMSNRDLFLTVLEPGSLRSEWPEDPLLEADLSWPHMVGGATELSGASFIKSTSPAPEGL